MWLTITIAYHSFKIVVPNLYNKVCESKGGAGDDSDNVRAKRARRRRGASVASPEASMFGVHDSVRGGDARRCASEASTRRRRGASAASPEAPSMKINNA